MKSLIDVLTYFDECLARKQATVRDMLAPGATADRIERCANAIGKRFPSALRTLYAWHDGESEGATVFEALCRDKYEGLWQGYTDAALEIRFMSLAEVTRSGDFGGRLDDGGRLVPFLWLRRRGAAVGEEPADHDWLLAVDTARERVWLFEVGEVALEGTFEEAATLAEWLEGFTARLMRPSFVGLAATPAAKAATATPTARQTPSGARGAAARPSPGRKASVEPPAVALLRLMVEKELVELAPEATLADVAARLEPHLHRTPRKRAVAAAIAFFEEDATVAELYADDDVLRALLEEFVA